MTKKLFGDMTADALKKIGAEKLTKTYERLTGKPCNCANRRKMLNNIHRMVAGQQPNRPERAIPQVARPPVKQYNPSAAPVDELPPRK